MFRKPRKLPPRSRSSLETRSRNTVIVPLAIFCGVRGVNRPETYNSRVLLLIDGLRTNNNVYEQAMLGTEFPLDVDLIERVEIVRGPSSSLYGTSAFFAVINVITRKAEQ